MHHLSTNFSKKKEGFLLSVITATYNREKPLSSLLARMAEEMQPLGGTVQHVISDNNSSDRTEQMVAGHIRENPALAIEYYRQDRNLGACPNVFFLFNKAKGRFVWHISDDDLIAENMLGRVVEVLKKNAERYDLFLARVKGLSGWDSLPRRHDASPVIELSAGAAEARPYLFYSGFFASVILKNEVIRQYLPAVQHLHHTQFSTWALVLHAAQGGARLGLIDETCVHGNINLQGDMRIPYYRINVRGRIIAWQSLDQGGLKQGLRPYLNELAGTGFRRLAFPVSGNDREKILSEYIALWRQLGFPVLKLLPYFIFALAVPFTARKKLSLFLRRVAGKD